MDPDAPDQGGQSSTDLQQQARADQRKREKNVLVAFWGTLAVGVAALAIFAVAGSQPAAGRVFALAALVGGAAALLGALLGFLFGLPRGFGTSGASPVIDSGDPKTTADPESGVPSTQKGNGSRPAGFANNNLLEISDWLTKIIIGAGLVGLKDLVRWLGPVGDAIGSGVGLGSPLNRVFGNSIIVYFFAWGFLFVYIQTRTIISFLLIKTEHDLGTLGTVITKIVTAKVNKAQEESTQLAQESIRDAVNEVSEKLLPQIDQVSESSILALLYAGPAATQQVIQRAIAFLKSKGNETNGRVWLYLASAYGQQHAVASDDEAKQRLADSAFDALSKALTFDPTLRGLARGLVHADDPHHLPGDDDLASFAGDERFEALVGPKVPKADRPS